MQQIKLCKRKMEWAINLLRNGLCKAHPKRHELMVQRELRKRVIWFGQKESLAKRVLGRKLNVLCQWHWTRPHWERKGQLFKVPGKSLDGREMEGRGRRPKITQTICPGEMTAFCDTQTLKWMLVIWWYPWPSAI